MKQFELWQKIQWYPPVMKSSSAAPNITNTTAFNIRKKVVLIFRINLQLSAMKSSFYFIISGTLYPSHSPDIVAFLLGRGGVTITISYCTATMLFPV